MANYHVMYREDHKDWGVCKEGAERPSETFATQKEAVARARELTDRSGGGELNVHRVDGNRVRQKNTVGKEDPYPPKG